MAFLAERTDDPKSGVEAVFINKKEAVKLGWSGFPKKTRYRKFARASQKDKGIQDKKFPYVIRAEQNALYFIDTKYEKR